MSTTKLRIVFMGTPDFAVASLRNLVENNFNIVGVITAPDRPAGRGLTLKQSAVKEYAVSQNIPVLQPEKLKNPEFLSELEALKADLQIVVAFRMLPEAVWNMPRLGSFNLHGSLLPQYRGAAPINWAVINGEKETGVTTFFLQHEIDTGDILLSSKTIISEDDTAGTVHDRLMQLGAELVLTTVNAIEHNTTKPMPQLLEGIELKKAPKIFKEDCHINWQNSAVTIRNMIRGLSPYPAAWTELKMIDNTLISLKIFEATLTNTYNLEPGKIESDGKTYLKIGTKNGDLSIDDLQLAGKKRMKTTDLLRGFKIENCLGVN